MLRIANLGDMDHIMSCLVALLSKSPAPQMKYADTAVARQYIKRAVYEQRVWFVGGYMLMVDVGSDWYSAEPYLIEQIILKVYPEDKTATVHDAVASLDVLRKKFNCVMTVVGDTQIGYMVDIYKAAGYKHAGVQLVKEN
jgi:hypothetical protein